MIIQISCHGDDQNHSYDVDYTNYCSQGENINNCCHSDDMYTKPYLQFCYFLLLLQIRTQYFFVLARPCWILSEEGQTGYPH